MEIGYLYFWDMDCTFILKNQEIFIIPKTKEGTINLHRNHIFFEDPHIELKFNHEGYKYNLYSTSHKMINDYCIALKIDYFIKVLNNENYMINTIEFIGDELDKFFNPGRFFQINYDFNIPLHNNELEASNFKFTYKNKQITVQLKFGNILSGQNINDLKLHSKLLLKIPPTQDLKEIHEYYLIIKKFIQIVTFQSSTSFKPSKLYSDSKGSMQIIGSYFSDNYQEDSTLIDSEYIYFIDNIDLILQFCANNLEKNLNFLPDKSVFYNNYTGDRILKIFSSFEKEFQLNNDLSNIDTAEFEDSRKEILKFIRELPRDDSEERKKFLDGLGSSVSNFGKNYGQKRKIIVAYEYCDNVLKNSIRRLFFNNFDLKKVAQRITDLRNKLTHDNPIFIDTNNIEELRIINFLDILNYTLILKRIGLEDEKIKVVIGLRFHINNSHYDFLHKYLEEHLKK